MKHMRLLLLASTLVAICLAAVTYTACNKDKCHNVLCLNKGTCNGGICECPVGYEGLRCDTLSRDKFVFTYNGGDTCSNYLGHYHQYPIQLLAIAANPFELTMKNFIGNLQDSAICTIQSTDSFTFIGANNGTTYTGWGRMRNDSLWMAYSVEHDTSSYSCVYFGQSLRVGANGH